MYAQCPKCEYSVHYDGPSLVKCNVTGRVLDALAYCSRKCKNFKPKET